MKTILTYFTQWHAMPNSTSKGSILLRFQPTQTTKHSLQRTKLYDPL